MTSKNETWPGRQMLDKNEIERMYRIAYSVNPSFLKIHDVVDFGIDLHRLKEFGDVTMKKELPKLRKGAKELWSRMDDHQKAAFLVGTVIEGLRNVAGVLQDLEKLMTPMPDVHDGLEMAQMGLYTRIPKSLRDAVDKGFGKWKTNGKA